MAREASNHLLGRQTPRITDLRVNWRKRESNPYFLADDQSCYHYTIPPHRVSSRRGKFLFINELTVNNVGILKSGFNIN